MEKNAMERAVVNCGVGKKVGVRNTTLRKGSTGLLYQRAGKQLEQQRSVLGYRSGYNNGHTNKYPLDTLNGYIGKYLADTKARTVVRYLASEPDREKRMAVTRQLVRRYKSRLSGSNYKKQ